MPLPSKSQITSHARLLTISNLGVFVCSNVEGLPVIDYVGTLIARQRMRTGITGEEGKKPRFE